MKILQTYLKNLRNKLARYRKELPEEKYYLITFNNILHLNCNNRPLNNPHKLDIVTVAFNNPKVVEYQIKLLNKYIQDPYCYTVADNSTDPLKQESIMQLCKKYSVGYIRLPKNSFSGSLSHGLALNWVFKHYLKPRKADYFGFIDHDIFPIRSTKIIDFLKDSKIFGLIQRREKKWYLWPGLCFFKYTLMKNCRVDFMPGKGYDTGGRNWESVYSKLDVNKVPWLKHEYGCLRKGKVVQSDWIEFIGDWLHTFNASNWMKIKDGKDILVNNFLSKYLKTNREGAIMVMRNISINEIVKSPHFNNAIIRNDFSGFREDYLVLHCLIRKYKPNTFIEIGTSTGIGTKVICTAMETNKTSTPTKKVYSLDVPPETDPKIIYPGGEDGHPDKTGKYCNLPFIQLFGNSLNFNFTSYFPIDGWFIDGKHSYEYVKNDTKQALKSNPILIVWHDMQIQGVFEAVLEVMQNRSLDYDLFRVSDTRMAFAVRKNRKNNTAKF